MYELCDTVSLEIELDDINPFNTKIDGFRATHDASCESDIMVDKKYGIKIGESGFFQGKKATIGGELVSVTPINTTNPEYLSQLKGIFNRLFSLGESPKSERAGIHFHFSLAVNLKILKAIIRLTRHLEDTFFRIGGMGYEFRGVKNDFVYCRPITKFGPSCVPVASGIYTQVFNTDDLLKSKSVKEFKERYGNIDRFGSQRYIPIRYHWLNLLCLFTQGSLEFRVFNKVMNPIYIQAAIEFCKKVCETVVYNPESTKNLSENSIYDNRDKNEIVQTAESFMQKTELDTKFRDILVQIILDTPEIKVKPEYTYTHLMFHRNHGGVPRHFEHTGYMPEIIKEKIKEPKFTDIHNLRNELEKKNKKEIILTYGNKNPVTEKELKELARAEMELDISRIGGRRRHSTPTLTLSEEGNIRNYPTNYSMPDLGDLGNGLAFTYEYYNEDNEEEICFRIESDVLLNYYEGDDLEYFIWNYNEGSLSSDDRDYYFECERSHYNNLNRIRRNREERERLESESDGVGIFNAESSTSGNSNRSYTTFSLTDNDSLGTSLNTSSSEE